MGDNELSQGDIDALFSGAKDAAPSPQAEAGQNEAAGEPGDVAPAESSSTEARTSTAVADPLDDKPVAQPVEFPQLQKGSAPAAETKIDFLLDVPLLISVELGRTNMFIRNVLNLGVGSVVELNKLAGEPVDLLINNKLVARGEVVVINENFGVKIIDIISPEQRIKNLKT